MTDPCNVGLRHGDSGVRLHGCTVLSAVHYSSQPDSGAIAIGADLHNVHGRVPHRSRFLLDTRPDSILFPVYTKNQGHATRRVSVIRDRLFFHRP